MGGTRLNHHQCLAPTWVMHGSHLTAERSPHIGLRQRGRETLSQLLRGMIRWPDGGSQVGYFAMTPGNPLLFATSAVGSLMTTMSQDLGFTSHPKDGSSYSAVSPSLHWGIGILLLGPEGRLPPTGPPTPLPAAT